MIDKKYAIAMAETLHYLKGIPEQDIKKIPNQFLEFLKENADSNYKCDFDYNKSLKELHLKNETYGIISIICYNYWCETPEEKMKYLTRLKENEKNYQEKLETQYDLSNLFKNRK